MPGRDEYQLDKVIVWVNYGASERQDLAMPLILRQFPAIWTAIPEVISAASELFRARVSARACALSVWGIELEPYAAVATYHVGVDLERWSLEGRSSELPPDSLVYVTRDRDGALLVQAD